MSATPANIKVIRGGACGDFVLTLSAIDALHQAFPGTELHLVGNPQILRLAHPERILDHNSACLVPLYTRTGPLPAATRALFNHTRFVLAYAVDPEGILEFRLEELMGDEFVLCDPRPTPGCARHIVDHLLQPLHQRGIAVPDPEPRLRLRDEDRVYAEECWERYQLVLPVVALHPGSGGRHKCWPLPRFLALADELRQQGCRVLLLYGAAEADLAPTLQERLPPDCLLLQPPSLLDLAGLIEKADLFIGNDSGPGHIAAALGTPTVALFGPTDPDVWGPRGSSTQILQAPTGLLSAISMDSVLKRAIGYLQGG